MAMLSISDYYDDPANWEAADPDYLGLLNVVGGGANTSHSDTATHAAFTIFNSLTV